MIHPTRIFYFFFFNDTATTEIYTLSLHDALPISKPRPAVSRRGHSLLRRGDARQHEASLSRPSSVVVLQRRVRGRWGTTRSEEHTSELQSHLNLVCRLLLEKKKNVHTLSYDVVSF